MLHGVVMDVVDMLLQVHIVHDLVFPIAPFPNAALALELATWPDVFTMRYGTREPGLD